MSVRLVNPPIEEYEHLVWCPTCKYGIKVWSQIPVERGHGCLQCDGQMEVYHRDCTFPSPVRRTQP